MSAVGALFMTDGGPVSAQSLDRMQNALRLHGPDRQTRQALGSAGLVSCQSLGFTPEDRFERQPVLAASGFALVFAGWISNRDVIEAQLGIERKRAHAMSDSALAAEAWQRWDEDALTRLDGDFALIVWEEERKRMRAARAIASAPPIHFHEANGRIALATAPKGLFALGDIDREVDELAVADSLMLNYEEVERSYFKGISRLRLGSVMTVTDRGIQTRSYYDPSAIRDIRFARDEDYVEAARELLDRAVGRAMRANETPAISLSSGLDSTTVAVSAIDWLRKYGDAAATPLVSFTSVPEPGWDGRTHRPDWSGDESGPVRAMQAMYPELDARFVDCEGLDFTSFMDQLFLLAEVPPRNIANLHWCIRIPQQVRAMGKRVLLNGNSGNATISLDGNMIFPELARRGKFVELFRELPKRRNLLALSRTWFFLAVLPLLPRRLHHAIMRRTPRGDREQWTAIRPDYLERADFARHTQESGFDDIFQTPPDVGAYARAMLFQGARDEGQSVIMGLQALTGVQQRDPLADRELIEFCHAIPSSQLRRRGENRWLVRRLMANRLPSEILNGAFGQQAADSHQRTTRQLPAIRAELEAAREDPMLSEMVDVERLLTAIGNWPEQQPLSHEEHADFRLLRNGLHRAITTVRYVKWIRGTNR